MGRARTFAAVILSWVAMPSTVGAQSPGVGVELRAYPAGLIPTARIDARVSGRVDLNLSGGVNVTDRRGYGEHDDEKGHGLGAGAGLTFRPAQGAAGWVWGARAEVWDLDIDWEDQGRLPGSTDVLVLQPTVRVGYRWPVGGSSAFEAGASLGMEINVRTRGEDVGQGPILLVGVAWILAR